jgi:hypothetical protein
MQFKLLEWKRERAMRVDARLRNETTPREHKHFYGECSRDETVTIASQRDIAAGMAAPFRSVGARQHRADFREASRLSYFTVTTASVPLSKP